MAYKTGLAASDLALLAVLHDLLTGVSTPAYTAAGGGNPSPTITQPTASGHKTETWVITCTTGGGNGVAEFSVVGSVSGAQTAATAGSAYDDIVAFTIDANGGTFVAGDSWTFTTGDWEVAGAANVATETPVVGPSNVGNGTISTPTVTAGHLSEEFVITCTTPGGAGVAVFSVVSTLRGTMATATADSAYSSDGVAFTITAGATPFSAGDEFRFRNNAAAYLRGAGAADTAKPLVGIRTLHDRAADRYNWVFQGATSYNAALNFDQQAGAIPTAQGEPTILLWDGNANFAITATSDWFAVVAYAASEPAELAFGGYVQPYGPSGVWPAPLLIAGCHFDTTKIASVQESTHTNLGRDYEDDPGAKSATHLRMPGGAWARLRAWGQTTLDNTEPTLILWPSGVVATNLAVGPTPGGDRLIEPLELVYHDTVVGSDEATSQTGNKALVGTLPPLGFVSGYSLSTGDILDDGTNDWIAFANTYRSGVADFLALKLEA